MAKEFRLNQERLDLVTKVIYDATIEGKGVFRGGLNDWRERYMPEYKLPIEFEYEPKRGKELRDPKNAALFLWSRGVFERRNDSQYLLKQIHTLWADPEKRWFFYPEVVSSKSSREIGEIVYLDIRYRVHPKNETSPAEKYLHNAQLLCEKYNGNPREIIQDCTVKEARKNLMEFEGIGTGIANMFIREFMGRGIAVPKDPENALFKIDTHKARIAINTGAIELINGSRDIHVDALVDILEKGYLKACRKYNLSMEIADSALWVVGSEVCIKRNYEVCLNGCYLASLGLCQTSAPLNRETGRYDIKGEDGGFVDTRHDRKQGHHQMHFLSMFRDML